MKTFFIFYSLFLLIGCNDEPKYAPMEKCVIDCVERYTAKYLSKIYGTSDKFYDQFVKLCEHKKKVYNSCVIGARGEGYFRNKEVSPANKMTVEVKKNSESSLWSGDGYFSEDNGKK